MKVLVPHIFDLEPPPQYYEYGFAGRSGTSTSADYYAASEDVSSYGDVDDKTYPSDSSDSESDNLKVT